MATAVFLVGAPAFGLAAAFFAAGGDFLTAAFFGAGALFLRAGALALVAGTPFLVAAFLVAAFLATAVFLRARIALVAVDPLALDPAFFAAVVAFDGGTAFLGLDGAAFFTAVTSASFKVPHRLVATVRTW